MKLFIKMLLLLIATQYWGCKKDCPEPCQDASNPDCENYDPCLGKREVNARFTIRYSDNGFEPPEEWCLDRITFSDTLATSGIRVKAPKNNLKSTYEWQIGTDPTIRTSNEFEISFEDELRANGWERSIPITLTIRTPNSSCLANKADTLIKVTRNVFFTKYITGIFNRGYGNSTLVGKFTHDPTKTVTLELIDGYEQTFRRVYGYYWVVVGLPNADTLITPPSGCGFKQGCGSYTHGYLRWDNTSVCSWVALTKYMNEWEILINYPANEITLRFSSNIKGHEFFYEFKGKKI